MNEIKHLAPIQLLRFVAATLVVFYHSTGAIERNIPGAISTAFRSNAEFGVAGVHIFFVISGVVMAYTTSKRKVTITSFMWRRFIRIYPIYWVYAGCYLMSFLVIGREWPEHTIASLMLAPGHSADIIVPAWTLTFEVFFYLCFSAIVGFRPIIGLLVLSSTFVALIAARAIISYPGEAAHVATNPLLLEFVSGAWLGFALAKGYVAPPGSAHCAIASGFVGFCLWFALPDSIPSTIAMGLPSILLVAGVAFSPQLATSELVGHISKLGDSSYSLYLIHILGMEVLLRIFVIWAPHPLPFIGLQCAALTAVSVYLGHIYYKHVEMPILKAVRSVRHFYITAVPGYLGNGQAQKWES